MDSVGRTILSGGLNSRSVPDYGVLLLHENDSMELMVVLGFCFILSLHDLY